MNNNFFFVLYTNSSAGPTNPDSVPSHVQLGHCPLTNRQPLDVHPQNLEL